MSQKLKNNINQEHVSTDRNFSIGNVFLFLTGSSQVNANSESGSNLLMSKMCHKMTFKHCYNTLNTKFLFKVIVVLISMYTVSVLIKALRVLNSSSSLPLVDLVGLAWKHRMKHAKLGPKEAHRLSRGWNTHKHIQTIESWGWPQCIMGAVICVTYLGQRAGLTETQTADRPKSREGLWDSLCNVAQKFILMLCRGRPTSLKAVVAIIYSISMKAT